jgi:hypothetical protein
VKRYPDARNALGELICPGCGDHFMGVSAYCSLKCKERIRVQGGRLDRAEIAERIARLGPL